MRTNGGILIGAGLLALSACSTTTVATTGTTDGATKSSVDQIVVSSAAATTTPTTVATTVPETTVPPTTVAPTTTDADIITETTTPEATVESTTTTTIAPDTAVTVPAINPPIQAVGSSSGEATKRAQWRLLQLGFWLREPNGEFDDTTRQAVLAFQKYYGLERDGQLGPLTAEVLSNVTIRPHGRSNSDTLAEVDKNKQVLFLVKDGVTQWVLSISSGSGVPYNYASKKRPGERETGDAVTRNGLHKIYREQADGWWDGDLGRIYRPKYFTGGIAFHGYNSVPAYPASHGCVRLSLPAMDWIWENDIMPMGLPVWVHEGAAEEYDSVVDVNQRVWAAHNGDNADG